MARIAPFAEWTVRGRWWPTARRSSSPALALVVHHSVTTILATTLASVQAVEEVIYGRRLSSRFSMIAYSFLITPDGAIWEGRGTVYRNGANNRTKRNVPYTNSNTLSVCFVGNFHPGVAGVTTLTPTPEALAACADLVAHLRAQGALVAGSDLVAHSMLHATACCGDNLRNELSTIRRLIADGTPPEEGDDMHVRKINADDTSGWVVSGGRELFTDQIAGWEETVGPDRVFVNRHMQSFADKTEPVPVETVAGPSAETIAAAVLERLAQALTR